MKSILPFLLEKIAPVISFLHSTTRRLIGEVHWHPPSWVVTTGARITQHPRQAWAVVLAVVLAVPAIPSAVRLINPPEDPDIIVAAAQIPDLSEITDDGLLPQPLVVEFSRAVCPLDRIGKPIATGIKMSPVAAGAWSWSDDRHLLFEPKEDWPASVDFQIAMDRSLFAPGVKLHSHSVKFRTRPFSASIDDTKFYVNPKESKIRQITATLHFSHRVDLDNLKNELLMDGPDLEKMLDRKPGEPEYELKAAESGQIGRAHV